MCCSANRGRLIKRASASVERPDALAWPTCKTYAGNTARMTRQMWTTDCMVLQRRTDPALIRYTHPRRFPLRMQLPARTTFARSLQPTPDARDPSSRSLQTVRGLHPKVPTRIHLPEHLARRRPPLKAPPQPARISGPQGLLPNPTTLSAAVPLNHPHNSSVFPLAGAALAHFLPRAQRAKRRMTIEWLMGSTVDPSAMTITCRS